MSVLWDYWARWSTRLAGDFERVRAGHSDSDVKGGRNEAIVAEFLRSNVGSRHVAINSQVIDSSGHASDEVDVAICNSEQPMIEGEGGGLLIVEGVDAVLQVKARLSGDEIVRAVKNARSVKQLTRKPVKGAQAWGVSIEDADWYVSRVPYFVFAFESDLKPSTALARLDDECEDIPLAEQPDALFVLNRYSVLNVRENKGKLRMKDGDAHGFHGIGDPVDHVLPMLMWCLYVTVPRIQHPVHPVVNYGFGGFVRRIG